MVMAVLPLLRKLRCLFQKDRVNLAVVVSAAADGSYLDQPSTVTDGQIRLIFSAIANSSFSFLFTTSMKDFIEALCPHLMSY